MTKRLYPIVLFITIVFTIVGCSSNEIVKNTVNGYLEAIKQSRINEIEDYMSIVEEDIISEYISNSLQNDVPNPSKVLDLVRTITSKIEYSIVSANTKEENATVVVNIKTVDSKYVIKESYTSIANYISINKGLNIPEGKAYTKIKKKTFDEMTDTIMENVNDPKVPYIENKVELQLIYDKNSGRWIINNDKKTIDDLLNAILGDFPDVLEKLKSDKL